jgi:hypothetical protein
MIRFRAGRRDLRRSTAPPGGPARKARGATVEPAALQIEELEPRLTPDYLGSGSGGSNPPPGGGSTGRTVGWGC